MHYFSIFEKSFSGQALLLEEALRLYTQVPLPELMLAAHTLRNKLASPNKVGWIIDRNINITNACMVRCRFCNFHRPPGDEAVYITTADQYREKISYLFQRGGDQVLLQGGIHPALGLKFYKDLFESLKAMFPTLKLHALGPAEIHHIARKEGLSYRTILQELIVSGLDSLPGAGAEILCDRVRKMVSPAKCSASQWLEVMTEAHKLNMVTSATMMYGHVETPAERMEHLLRIRDVQAARSPGHYGFLSFIPWPFQDKDTFLQRKYDIINTVTGPDYLRMIATARLVLNNIPNIQASWLTVGKPIGQLCLHAGANDFGSVMIEENVVSAAGAHHQMDEMSIQQAIREAGFVPFMRNQRFEEVYSADK